MNSGKHRRWIEEYALLTENASELRAKHDLWYRFYQPATPGECEWLDMALMASVERGRVHASLTEIVNQEIRTAVFAYNCEQEDEVDRYRAMLETQPGAAVVGLKRLALGVRFLLGRWERLLCLMNEEGTLYGADRDEAINYQGAKVTCPEDLFHSEGAYLTYFYCLMCQPNAKDEQFVAMGNERWMPPSLMARGPEQWLGNDLLCRKLLVQLIQRELASLRAREALLRMHHETPGRDGAEIRKQVLASPLGAQLVRLGETHQRQFHRAHQAFLKGRAQSVKTGVLPGAPDPGLHGAPVDTSGSEPEPVFESVSAEELRVQRRQGADALAPGPENGIGVPTTDGDIQLAAVKATRPVSSEELNEHARASDEAAFTALATSPLTQGEACADYL